MSLILAVAASTLIASPVAAQGKGCFRLSDMGGHKVADSQTLYVSIRRKEIWKFEMNGACLSGAAFGDPLIVTPAGGGGLICQPLDLDIKVASQVGAVPCMLRSMTPLTPQEAAALPKKLRP